MKRLIPAVLASLLFIVGCPQPVDNSEPPVTVKPIGGNVASPGTSYNFLSAFTDALPCNGVALQWSIREQGIGWLAIDGNITQNGVWTSPACGSVWLGNILHIDAKCPATATTPQRTASAVIATVPEQVSGVQIAYAVRNPASAGACRYPLSPDGKNLVANGQLCPGSAIACGKLADGSNDPQNPSMCYCILAGETIQWYAKVVTTCGEIITPTPPATWPSTCL